MKILQKLPGLLGFIGFFLLIGGAGEADLNIDKFWAGVPEALLGLSFMTIALIIHLRFEKKTLEKRSA